jgi:hypothetical protein
MRKLILTALATVAMTGTALAQAAPTAPATAKPVAPTATPAQAAPVAARPLPSGPSLSVPNGAAASVQAAQEGARAKLSSRELACKGKGAAYKWKPPHVIGDANPKGGFYMTNYNGGCAMMSMKEALEKGLITINATARPN